MNNSFLNNLDNETVIRKTDINKMTERRRFKLIGLAVLFLLIALTLVFTSKEANAERPVKRIKQVVSVEIQRGDTLWSIASTYISDEYKDLNEYIDEIMISNGMSSDIIQAGKYIIVPYYADAS
jgi:cell division protein YceG involved in septum cleavage